MLKEKLTPEPNHLRLPTNQTGSAFIQLEDRALPPQPDQGQHGADHGHYLEPHRERPAQL